MSRAELVPKVTCLPLNLAGWAHSHNILVALMKCCRAGPCLWAVWFNVSGHFASNRKVASSNPRVSKVIVTLGPLPPSCSRDYPTLPTQLYFWIFFIIHVGIFSTKDRSIQFILLSQLQVVPLWSGDPSQIFCISTAPSISWVYIYTFSRRKTAILLFRIPLP